MVSANRVDIEPSASFDAYFNKKLIHLTCDGGSTSPLIAYKVAKSLKMSILPTHHLAKQADGVAHLSPCGEVHETLSFGNINLHLSAVVVQKLDSDCLLGEPFLHKNRIAINHFTKQINFLDNDGKVLKSIPYSKSSARHVQSRATVVRSPKTCLVFPGDFIEVASPISDFSPTEICVEPRVDSPHPSFPAPMILPQIDGHIRIPNLSDSPIIIKKNQHLAQVRSVLSAVPFEIENRPSSLASPSNASKPFSSDIVIDPDNQLSQADIRTFRDINLDFDDVFDPRIGKYNDASGKIRASIIIGSVEPPKAKAFFPNYNRSNMSDLQSFMDDLEDIGVLAKPEDVDVVVEYISPSFLVPKPSGGDRFVTSFVGLADYTKPPPLGPLTRTMFYALQRVLST